MSDEGRYSAVSRRVWVDSKFRVLSAAKPNAQTLWLRLLTGPELGCVPGLFAANERGLAGALNWPDAAFRKCWKEIADQEMAFADWAAGLVWVPKSLDHNPPHSPNVVLSWKVSLKELPESKLKASAMASIGLRVASLGEPWAKAWAKASGMPCRNQEQEHPSDLPSGISGSLPSPDPDLPESFSPPREGPVRPVRPKALLAVRVYARDWLPLDGHWGYGVALGLTQGEYDKALRDLRDKHGGRMHDPEWLDDKFCAFLEQVARSRQIGPKRAPGVETPAERRTREQLERVAMLEEQERLAAQGAAQ